MAHSVHGRGGQVPGTVECVAVKDLLFEEFFMFVVSIKLSTGKRFLKMCPLIVLYESLIHFRVATLSQEFLRWRTQVYFFPNQYFDILCKNFAFFIFFHYKSHHAVLA